VPISKRNRRGVLILGAILLVVIYTPRILAGFYKNDRLEYSVNELDAIETQIRESKASFKKRAGKKRKSHFTLPNEKFDPNDYSQSDWMGLGLSEKQANVVLRFTEHGIYSNEELKKVFVISDELFNLIQDSTVYPKRPVRNLEFKSELTAFDSDFSVDLNTATHEELIKLSGIGDYYADKIIDYRNKLGGYHDQEQLLELWKFTPDKLDKIKSQIIVSGNIRELSVNTGTYEDLVKHPYISSKVANSIVKMRSQRNGYKNLEDLMDSKLIDRELFNKLEPYIKL
jgi:competence ComEA-like helix-hairpin-helix protein